MSFQTSETFFCEAQKERSHHPIPNNESNWGLWVPEKHHESSLYNFCAVLQIFQRQLGI